MVYFTNLTNNVKKPTRPESFHSFKDKNKLDTNHFKIQIIAFFKAVTRK